MVTKLEKEVPVFGRCLGCRVIMVVGDRCWLLNYVMCDGRCCFFVFIAPIFLTIIPLEYYPVG
jgi:hypothetical protein